MATVEDLARRMIPIMIYIAQRREKPIFYSDLAMLAGYNSNRIGKILGCVDDILKGVKTVQDIPSINHIVVTKSSGLPADGITYVDTEWETLNNIEKAVKAKVTYEKVKNFNWQPVLDELKLDEYIPNEEEVECQTRRTNYGEGEGLLHKRLKEYVFNNPSAIGIKNVAKKEVEYKLLSGDFVDIYFELKNGDIVAVEVKSELSDNADIMRGLYQCVKYKSVLEAQVSLKVQNTKVSSILVIEGVLCNFAKSASVVFGNKVIENFKVDDTAN